MADVVATGQYLTFSLGDEVYALEVFKVREVLEPTKITRVPRMPPYMLGVINLRGSVVPVIDLRRKLGLERVEVTLDSGIIILEFEIDGEIALMGIFVDSVYEVINLSKDSIEPSPSIGTRIKAEFISGVGKQNEEFIMLMDIDRIFGEIDESALTVSEGQIESAVFEEAGAEQASADSNEVSS